MVCNSCTTPEYESFGSVYGVVSDSETGETIDVVSVVLSPGGKTYITGTDGCFEFKDIDPQQYTVTVQKLGYQTNRKIVTVFAGEYIPANILLTKN